MLKISTLFSGSSGNCTLVSSNTTAILIDCGRNCKAVCEGLTSLGYTLADISAIFITHEHNDHISALDVMSRKHAIPIHISSPSAPTLKALRSAGENTVVHSGLVFNVTVGDITVSSFPLPHDSMAHVGYKITSFDGDAVGVATDMGYVTDDAREMLSGCRQVLVESNHDVNMLKRGPYPYYLKQRILSKKGHLSNEACAEFCRFLYENGTKAFLLGHLSSENNTPELAENTIAAALPENVIVKTAKRMCATELL